jgi:hypothetical protein
MDKVAHGRSALTALLLGATSLRMEVVEEIYDPPPQHSVKR